MAQETLTNDECLAFILHFAFKHNIPPEVVRRNIDERMTEEGASDLGEYLYRKAGHLLRK